MAIWRHPELESLLGGPLDAEGITQQAIERLVDEGVRESEVLDFKAALEPPTKGSRPGWLPEQEFAKDVAAFANHRGGLLLIGVDDVDGVATGSPGWAMSLTAEQEERRLRQAVVNYLSPVATFECVWLERTPTGYFLGVVVPPSPRSPHAVTSPSGEGRTALRYPVRHGSDTVWLSEPEVAERYRRRSDTQAAEATRIEAVIENGATAISRTSGVWLYTAIVPEAPIHGRLDKSTVERVDRWQRSNGPTSPLGRSLPAYGRGIPAPGRVVFTGSRYSSEEDETDIRDALVELYVDGGVFAAVPIALRSTGEEDGREVGEITLVDDGILLMDLSLRWCAAEAGAWGAARVVMGFLDADAADGVLDRPIELVQSDTGTVHRIRPSRTVTGPVRSETVADLSATLTMQQRLSVLHQALAGLLHWFGLPEPAQILADGTLVPRQFTMSRYREAEAWATANGVDAERLRGT